MPMCGGHGADTGGPKSTLVLYAMTSEGSAAGSADWPREVAVDTDTALKLCTLRMPPCGSGQGADRERIASGQRVDKERIKSGQGADSERAESG